MGPATIPSGPQPKHPMQDDEYWRELCASLGLPEGTRPDVVRQAFCHASYAREAGLGPLGSNQRLEFLGDAVLDLILVDHLYLSHPDVPEGRLTRMKAALARSYTLARIARKLGLGDHLLLGKGEEETGGRNKPSLLADCLEALVGAIYLCVGLAATRSFVLERFAEALREVECERDNFDSKTALQELLQDRTRQTPTYHTVQTLGPPHDREFVVEVHFGGQVIGRGRGRSKQAAQQSAAQAALQTQDSWLSALTNISPSQTPAGSRGASPSGQQTGLDADTPSAGGKRA